MIIKLCPRCHKPIPYGARYCPACTPVAEREQAGRRATSGRRHNERLDKNIKAFYRSKEWEQLRLRLLAQRGYMCEGEGCRAIAVDVHHVKHLDTPEGWKSRLEPGNLKILCVKCHNSAHDRFGR